ncbi:pyridine nucleotide-disulfide oxidoreductase domain-containing protein 2 isoform X5 [Mobula birostris]|uniref:pyridine nucleotide-disulfide oxidoreductase domain-containing protein 2 isoform X5 n=1 Tax=Mobula birostris TaxID=1983395 RepID=UPI003B285EC5
MAIGWERVCLRRILPRVPGTRGSAGTGLRAQYDAVVIGGGHNGLIAAAYLQKSGVDTAVLERRHVIGGAAVTEELIPGFKFSRASYVLSLLRPQIYRELELKRHGLRVHIRDPSSFTPMLEDGVGGNPPRSLLLGSDTKETQKQIARFSLNDARAYAAYEALTSRIAAAIQPLLDSVPVDIPSLTGSSLRQRLQSLHTVKPLVQAGLKLGKDIPQFYELLTAPISRPVNSILVDQSGTAQGVVLQDGTEIRSKVVLSNATPHVTFLKLTPQKSMPKEFIKEVSSIDYTSPVTKINVAVDQLPGFLAVPKADGMPPAHYLAGTIHLNCEDMAYITEAYDEAYQGLPSTRPLIELCIPSVLDSTLAPPGCHVLSIFTQYTPYHLQGGKEWDEEQRNLYADRVFDCIEQYAPGFKSSVVGRDILTPPDLEKVFGLTGGNIFHGAMTLDRLYLARPSALYSGYRSPVKGLYLCGSGAHPGGGVMGSAGRNAAHVVLSDLRRSRWSR